MKEVFCPNCHSVTPAWRYCRVCNAKLEGLLTENRRTIVSTIESAATSVLDAITPGWLERTVDKAEAAIDPHLYRQVQRIRGQGIRKLASSSAKENQLPVIAAVSSKFFKAIQMAGKLVDLGQIETIAEDEDGSLIVTGRIRSGLKRFIWELGATELRGARRVRPLLERAIEDVRPMTEITLPDQPPRNGNTNVIIGIVDFGFDFVHRNFRDDQGNTRLLALWDQSGTPRLDAAAVAGTDLASNLGFESPAYGRVYMKSEIDKALNPDSANPYQALGYEPPRDSMFDIGAHGTYVADVAAGNGLGTDAPGLAPNAGIVFVDLSTAGTPLQGPRSVGSTFGDSAQLLDAVKFIFDFADSRNLPCVVNLSVGTNGGPHDGSSLIERALDRLVSRKDNRAVVIAAGNSFGSAIHATGAVPVGGSVDLRWRISDFDTTSNELEVWYDHDDRFTVEIIDPTGIALAMVAPGETWDKEDSSTGLLTVVNTVNKKRNQGNVINLFFEADLKPGVWTLRLHNYASRRGEERSRGSGKFNAWIERDDFGQSRFESPKPPSPTDGSYEINSEYTLSSIACGNKSIVVGAYNANESGSPLFQYSSAGPTRDEREKPEVSAPGELVLAAHSGTRVLRHRQSGTSISAAVVTGTVALMLAEAQKQGLNLNTDRIKQILIETARKDFAGDWHDRYGYGRVNVAAALSAVHPRTPDESSVAGLTMELSTVSEEMAISATP